MLTDSRTYYYLRIIIPVYYNGESAVFTHYMKINGFFSPIDQEKE
jgi:hypothetical protein